MKNGQILPVKLGGYECIGSPVLIVDPQTAAILDANESACIFYGYSHTDFIQKKILDLAAISVEEAWQRIQKISSGEITHMSLQHRVNSGEMRDVEVDLRRGSLDNKLVNIATIHDVTERNRAERNLKENEQKYHGFVSEANEAFTLVNEQGVVIEWNPASEQLTGIPASEVVGQFVWDVQLRVTSPEHVTTEMRDLMRQRIQVLLDTGSGPLLGTYETEIKRTDGKSIIAAQKLFTIKTAQGFQIGTIARDITQERQTQRELKVSEERYRSLFENMREGFALHEIIQDETGRVVDFRIIDANPAYESHTGQKLEKIIGHTIRETLPTADSDMIERYGKVALTGEPLDFEYYSKTFNRHVHVRSFRPRANQFASIFEDITERKQTEEKLRESEARFSTVFHSSHDAISIARLSDDIYLDVNEAFCKVFGLSRDQVIGRVGRELNIAANPEQRKEIMSRLLSQGQVSNIESQFRNHMGQTGWLLISAQIVKIFEQDCIVIFGKDITLRKQAEFALQSAHDELELRVQERTVELRRSLERLNLATGSANMGIWDWDIQKNELVWDQQMYSLYGVKPEDFSGAYEAWLGGVYPDDRQHSDEFAQRALRGEVTYDTELRVLWPDGSTHWLKVNGQVFWDEQCEPVRMLGVNYDITERKYLEAELRESEQKYTTLFEKTSVPSLLYRMPEIIIENVNEAFEEISGYQRWELLGKNVVDIGMAPPDQYAQTVAHFYEQGFIIKREAQLFTKSGEERTILLNINPVRLRDEPYVISTFLDITELKQAELKLSEANLALEKALQVKDEFLAAMSHELRTPINGIMGMAEILQMTTANMLNDKQSNYLTGIEQSGRRLLDMVNNVLDYTQLQGGTLKPHMRLSILDENCKAALQKISPQAESKQQHVRYLADPSGIKVLTDENRLQKILFLLLENASKFTEVGGEFGIEVTGNPKANMLEIAVWDTGIGIAEENFPRLFKPFAQLDASLARQYEGAGLGLAITKSITELLGGQITVQSTLGKGSRFILTLPWDKSESV